MGFIWKFYKTAIIGFMVLSLLVEHGCLFAQVPVAGFTSSVTYGCSPLTVTFLDSSTNNPTGWLWNFGNTNNSVLQNPSAVYTTPGSYTVTLITTNLNGSDTVVKADYITVFQNPAADFNADTTNGCNPLSVQFFDLSSAGSAPVDSWFWDFGDGNSSSVQSPLHTFTLAATNSVSLTSTDTNGCVSIYSINNYIRITDPPLVNFTSTNSDSCGIPFTVSFTDLTVPGTDPISSWMWNFGDSTPTDSSQNPSHTYTGFGLFDIALTITDTNTCSSTYLSTNYVKIQEFVADFDMDTTVSCPDKTIIYSDLSAPSPASWIWDFGNGDSSILQNPSSLYSDTDTFAITLIATSSYGCIDTVQKEFINVPLIVQFSADSLDNCELPFPVNFSNNSSGTAPLTYQWDFGDGSPVDTGQSPSYSYSDTGVFDVSLMVTDGYGCSTSLSLNDMGDSIVIYEPFAHYDYLPVGGGCIPLTIHFTNTSANYVGNIVSWSWDFGDTLSGANNSSSIQDPSHTFDSAGVYWVSLTVTTDRGCTNTFDSTVEAGFPPILVDFAMSDTIACYGQTVSFTDSSVGTINQWIWSWGDGTLPSLAQNPTHGFQDTGWVTVTLSAGLNGCLSSISKQIYIMPPGPWFSLSPWLSCDVPHQVTFTDQTGGAETWLWDFDDGFTSTDTNVVHTYTTPGLYFVQLSVTNSNGCIASETQEVRIPEVNANFGATDTIGCFYLFTSFNDNSTYAFTTWPWITNWYWDFGDGTTYSSNSWSTRNPPLHYYGDTGTYDVMLVVTEYYGCKDTLIREDFITIHGVYPNYSADTIAGCAPLQVDFTDLTTGTSPVTAWFWNFGDGSPPSSVQNPSHTFGAGAPYNVTLSVMDSVGCIDQITKSGLISPTLIVPSFSCDTTLCLLQDAAIIDNSSGAGISYFWDFDDGYTDSLPNPSHGYADTGIYVITLTLSDTNGCVLSDFQSVEVFPQPIPGFSVDSLASNCPPLVANFTDSSSSDVVNWLWNFGDFSSSAATSPSHTYTYPDTFDITLTVTTAVGCFETLFVPDLIVVGGPTGQFNFSPVSGCVPLDVNFTATANNAIQFKWDFGDGNIDSISGSSILHTYLSPGIAHPLLVLKDALGCQREATKPIPDSVIIDEAVASFISDTDTVYTTLCSLDTAMFAFADQSYTLNPYSTISSWFWEFGDSYTSSFKNTAHIYGDTGVFTVTLTVGSTYGCSVSDSIELIVLYDSLDPIVVNITDSVNVSCFGGMDGSVLASVSGGDPPYTIAWNDVASQTTLLANSLSAGNYTVVAMDILGCPDSNSVTIMEPPLLAPNIAVINNISCKGVNDGFASVSVNGGTPPYTYGWNDSMAQITDSASSLSAGTLVVSVTDSVGCLAIDSIYLTEPDSLIISPVITHVACKGGNSGQIIANVSGGTLPYTYLWDTTSVQSDSVAVNLFIGQYSVKVTDTMGCVDSVTVIITEPDSLQASVASIDSILCFEDSTGVATIIPTGGTVPYSYIWLPSGGTAATETGLWAGMHYYTVTDSLNCVYIDSIEFTQPTDIVTITSGNDTICEFSTASINAMATGGTGILTYTWDNGIGNGPGPHSVAPGNSTSYNVVVTDGNGCTALDSLNIAVYKLLEAALSSAVFCVGDSQEVTAQVTSGAGTGYTYYWDFGDGSEQTTPDTFVYHEYSDTGTYVITLQTDPVPCVTDTLDFTPMTILPSPSANFSAIPATMFWTDPVTEFINMSDAGALNANLVDWLWDFGDGVTSNMSGNPIYKYQDTGTYVVSLAITNTYSCTDTHNITVRVEPGFDIKVPTAFTPDPNGPNVGYYDITALDNNIFYPTTRFVEEFHMMIFNRWGEMVFETFDVKVGWDGFYRGQLCQQDAYVWKIELRYANGVEYKNIGDVTLLR